MSGCRAVSSTWMKAPRNNPAPQELMKAPCCKAGRLFYMLREVPGNCDMVRKIHIFQWSWSASRAWMHRQGMRGICQSRHGGCPHRQDAGLPVAARGLHDCGGVSRTAWRGSFRTVRLVTAAFLLFAGGWILCHIIMFLFDLSVLQTYCIKNVMKRFTFSGGRRTVTNSWLKNRAARRGSAFLTVRKHFFDFLRKNA